MCKLELLSLNLKKNYMVSIRKDMFLLVFVLEAGVWELIQSSSKFPLSTDSSSARLWKADSICSWQLPTEQQSDGPGTHPSAFISPDPDDTGAGGKAREDQPNTKLDWWGLCSEWACSNVQIHIPSSKTKFTFTGHVSATRMTVRFFLVLSFLLKTHLHV